MKVKILQAFYDAETGIHKRDEIIDMPDEAAYGLWAGKLVEFLKEPKKPATKTKSTTKA